MLHSVSVSSSNSPSRTGLRLLSGSASAENLKDGSKKDPRYDEDFIDIENTKPYVKNPNIQVTERCENIFKEILQLNSVDIILLLQLLKERTGMDPYSDPSGDGLTFAGGKRKGAGVSTAEGAAPVVEKTVFELKLAGFDEKSKIKIIKEIRAITGLGLKEAKELVEGAPKIVKKDIKKAEAEELKGKLEAVGAVVEIV
jgi:large subunit ribosomal protein L7/L12